MGCQTYTSLLPAIKRKKKKEEGRKKIKKELIKIEVNFLNRKSD